MVDTCQWRQISTISHALTNATRPTRYFQLSLFLCAAFAPCAQTAYMERGSDSQVQLMGWQSLARPPRIFQSPGLEQAAKKTSEKLVRSLKFRMYNSNSTLQKLKTVNMYTSRGSELLSSEWNPVVRCRKTTTSADRISFRRLGARERARPARGLALALTACGG